MPKYLCITCGTVKENKDNGLCANGHDNWLEETDSISSFLEASQNLNVSIDIIISALANQIDLSAKSEDDKNKLMTSTQYTALRGLHCPVCGSDSIEGGN